MDPSTIINLLGMCAAVGACILTALAWRCVHATETGSAQADPNAVVGAGVLRRLVSPVAASMRPDSRTDVDEIRTQLLRAGRRSKDAVDRYLEDKVLFLVGGGLFALFVVWAVGGTAGAVLAMVVAVVGIRGPAWSVERRSRERQEAISVSLPAGVDLLMTCVRAGLSLEQALVQVADNIRGDHAIFADELGVTASELSAGVGLPDALRRLANRVGLDDLSALCGVIAQAHGLGAPVADTLDEYAESSRRQRMSVLEERAGKVAAKMTIPLTAFFLPAGMMVILGPAIIQLVRALK